MYSSSTFQSSAYVFLCVKVKFVSAVLVISLQILIRKLSRPQRPNM